MFISDRNIEKIHKQHCAGSFPTDEEPLLSFLLAYHHHDASTGFAFRIGKLKDKEWDAPATISPDIDVLEVKYPGDKFDKQTNPETTRGYEVKSGGKNGLTKRQLYNAVGQAQLLLTQPIDADGGMLEYASIAIPPTGLKEDWLKALARTLQATPVGLVVIMRHEVKQIVEPWENPFHSDSVKKQVVIQLTADYHETMRSPLTGLEALTGNLR